MSEVVEARARIRPGPSRPGEVVLAGTEPEPERAPVRAEATGGDDALAAGEERVLAGAFRLARRRRERVVRIDVPDPDWAMPAGWRRGPSGQWTHPDHPDAEPPHGPIVLSFHVRPITERQRDEIEERTTDFEANALGVPVPVRNHAAEFNSEMIIEATTDEDRQRIWRNPDLMAAAGVNASTALVDEILPMGFKALVVQKINEISGFGAAQTAARESILGNS